MIHVIKDEAPDKFAQRYLVDKRKNHLGLHDVCRCTFHEYPNKYYTNIWATLKGPFRKYKAERYVLVYDLPNNISRHDSNRICIEPSVLNGLLKARKGGLGDF